VFIRLRRSRHRRRPFRSQQAPSPAADLSYSRAEAARIAMRSASRRDLAEDRLISCASSRPGQAYRRERRGSRRRLYRLCLSTGGPLDPLSSPKAEWRRGRHYGWASLHSADGICGTAETCVPRSRCRIEGPRGDPMPMPMPPSGEGQLNFNGYAAAVWADRLRSFYEALPGELAPDRHWDLLLEIAVNAPEARMGDLRLPRHSDGPISQPGGCSLSG
jgi:hypothetical protein